MNTKVMKEFRRTNIALAIFFNIVTLDFYSIYWLQQERNFLRSKLPQDQIPKALAYICYASLALTFYYIPFYAIYFVAKLILLFDTREKMHKLLKITEKSHLWFNAVLLFFFGFLYIIYKIDQFPSTKKTPDNPDAHLEKM